jgi:hypothetical protein
MPANTPTCARRMMVNNKKDNTHLILTALGLVILGICTFKVLQHFRQHVDLVFADETGYMVLSFLFPKNIEEGYGPVYSMFYKFLGLFFKDSINLHYANLIIQSFLPAFGLFIFLRFFKVNIFISLWLSVGLLTSSLTMAFNWWPRISHFTLFLFFFYLMVLSRFRDPTKVFAFSAFAAFCFSYIRPEAFMTFMGLSAWTVLWYLLAGRKTLKLPTHEKWLAAAGLLLIAAVLYKIGPATSGGSRLGIALGQHYMYNYIEWNNLPLTEWVYWKDVLVATFGMPESLGEFFRNGRDELVRHITYNIGHYFRQAGKEIPGIFFPENIFGFPAWLGWLLMVVLAGARVLYVGAGNFFHQFKQVLKIYWPVIFVILAFVGPTLIASVIIYPREHYLIIQLTLGYFLLLLWLLPAGENAPDLPMKVTFPLAIAFGAMLVFATPRVFDYTTYKVWGEYKGVKNVKGIQAIRSFGITDKQVNMLELEGGYAEYVRKGYQNAADYRTKNYKWIIGIYKEDPFYAYLEKENINMVYVTDVLATCRIYTEDPEWNDFLVNYREKGWRKFLIPGSPDYIIVESSLLEK